MKIYKSVNVILLAVLILGTAFCYKNLPDNITLFMQAPNKLLFILVTFAIMFALTILSFSPATVSKSTDHIRNELTVTALNLLNIAVFLYYFTVLAESSGYQLHYLKVIVLIIGALMILVGNKLPQMPYGSCVGFKLPWILNDKLCWQKTHRFAGYTAIPFGILQCFIVLFVQDTTWAFVFGIGLWIIVTCVYSIYICIRNRKSQ